MGIWNRKKKYDSLYLEILKYAIDQREDGVSYNKLKEHLESLGYDFKNDCVELAVKQRFLDCFNNHIENSHPFKTTKDIDNHVDSNCILNGESCITYINYKTSVRNTNLALYAVLISLATFIYTLYIENKHTTENKIPHLEHLPIPCVSTTKFLSPKVQSHDSTLKKRSGIHPYYFP